MHKQLRALKAEIIKNRHSKILFISFTAFALVPVMSCVFMIVMQNPQALAKASLLNTKMEAMNVAAHWDALFMMLTQGLGIGGIMIFGFLASWIFGREYSENTVKDLLALPVSKTHMINAKYIVYYTWAFMLAISNALLGVAIGAAIGLPGFESGKFFMYMRDYGITAVLTVSLGTPIAFFSMWGKGYLAPLGAVALVLVFSQIIAALGYGQYFPWAVPALFSGVSGEYKNQLNPLSYLILFFVSILGYWATILYWKYTDHTK
jgi:ABC-2 type transport system permease protein